MAENREGRRDPKALRALAHPVRVALMELLADRDRTATQCSALLGESVANCSYHLRTLAKHGYVEQVGGGREKPWRLASFRQNLVIDGVDDESDLASEAATEAFLEHDFDILRQGIRTRAREPEDWREATGVVSATTFVTLEEMRELRQDLMRVLQRFTDRLEDREARPADASQVRIVLGMTRRPGGGPEPAPPPGG
ncbi:winged helix-turn-helix domain-containing protein [Actinoalloteichus spitiensis]|uniref:winged helix-turn-helix domain-containing protein n=1 Tax=Actinoalloteichus spitiensis TaxID=252394 RepID=UPI000368B794|nr:winged helix-turn-helix domain-containing protein [Actinoalloteichus spitiensis]